jgi:GWxTD domain-containing protein
VKALILMAGALAAIVAGQAATPYEKWLNEDVTYIIDDRERAAFEKLTTGPEREKFIEQFWQRRGTAAKEDHYRRIAYANQRFRTPTGRPGWLTDRGRMYIVYGPPDEIESHPSGGQTISFPYDVWMYHRVEGIGNNLTFTFVDRMRAGDYRLAPGNSR